MNFRTQGMMYKSNAVIILGAGCSKDINAPLMDDFIERAIQLNRKGMFSPRGNDALKSIQKAISELQIIHAKSKYSPKNLESLFTTIETGKLLNKFPGFSSEESIEDLANDLRHVIVETLEVSIKYDLPSKQTIPNPTSSYSNLVSMLENIKKKYEKEFEYSFITFNYDTALDFAMYRSGIKINYGLTNFHDGKDLLKLHGSLNWGLTKEGETLPLHLIDFFSTYKYPFGVDNIKVNQHIGLEIKSKSEQIYQGKTFLEEPMIIPPTWNKESKYNAIKNVWRRAAVNLSNAEHIFVLGRVSERLCKRP